MGIDYRLNTCPWFTEPLDSLATPIGNYTDSMQLMLRSAWDRKPFIMRYNEVLYPLLLVMHPLHIGNHYTISRLFSRSLMLLIQSLGFKALERLMQW